MNEGTVQVVKIVNGYKSELTLCPKCAAKYHQSGVLYPEDDSDSFAPFNFFNDLPKKRSVCPVCHTTLEQFDKSGYLGCQHCYEQFKPQVELMLKRVQGATSHVGKHPKGQIPVQNMQELRRLNAELKRAAEEERYEDAARLQARIQSMFKGVK